MLANSLLLAALTLVGAEKSATVVVPDVPEQSSVLAATELTNYVARMTGRLLKVETWSGDSIEAWRLGDTNKWAGNLSYCAIKGPLDAARTPRPRVFIGTLPTFGEYAPKIVREQLTAAKPNEAAWSGTLDGDLWIVGKEDVADLYATYRFLEQKLGVRWFKAATPDDPGDYVPEVKVEGEGLTVADFAECVGPDFDFRELDSSSAVWNVIPWTGLQAAYRLGFKTSSRNYYDDSFWWHPEERTKFRAAYGPRIPRRGFYLGGGHTMFTQDYYTDKVFKEHPEYFALREGKRQRYGCMFCLSNEELQDRKTEDVLRGLRKHSKVGEFLFGQADFAKGWCECDKCRALEGPQADPEHPNISTRMAVMANRMAQKIWAECPAADLHLWAYSSYRQLPKGVTLDPRLVCYFCTHGRCFGHALDDPNCRRNREVLQLMLAWQKILPRLYTYEYFTCTPPYYVCHELDEAHDLKVFKKLGIAGWKNECFFSGSKFVGEGGKPDSDISNVFPSNWQWLYVTGHLLWNADQDPIALLEDAESKYYGPAYPAMKKYHALRRQLWQGRRECTGYPQGDPRRPLLLNAPGAKDQLLAYLDEAEKQTSNSILRHRLALDRKWLNRYWIKPNEVARAKAGRTLIVPKTSQKIVIDGDSSDAGWLDALDVCDRLLLNGSKKPVPAEMTTRFGIVTDGDSLYFLCRAKEPDVAHLVAKATKHDDSNCFGDDSFEILLFPPQVENSYFHICVTAGGVVYDSQCPGEDTSCELGVEVKTGRDADGWFAEVRVPSKKIFPIVDGDKWRVMLVRNRRAGGSKGACVTLDGESPICPGEFPTFELGKSCIKNGSFDHVEKDGSPTGWSKTAGELRTIGNNNVYCITNTLNQIPDLPFVDHDRTLTYSFRAAGKGTLSVGFVRYHYTPDGDWRKRTMPPAEWGVGKFDLTDEMKIYSGTYKLRAYEKIGIYFSPQKKCGVTIDDITLSASK